MPVTMKGESYLNRRTSLKSTSSADYVAVNSTLPPISRELVRYVETTGTRCQSITLPPIMTQNATASRASCRTCDTSRAKVSRNVLKPPGPFSWNSQRCDVT